MTESRAEEFRVELVETPAELPATHRRELIDAFAELAARTTGGDDWRSYRPAVEGWRAYYSAVGARPQDYDRLVLIHDGEVLIHFTGIVRIELEPGRPLVFVRTAMTLGEYHGAGLLKRAIGALFTPGALGELTASGEALFAVRTANPIVYEATRHLADELAAGHRLELSLFPKILDDGSLGPVPKEIRHLARRVVEITSPGCTFVDETFVNEGYFKTYGPLYRESVFPCRNRATRRYFERVVDYANQDGILILVLLRSPKGKRPTGLRRGLRARTRAGNLRKDADGLLRRAGCR